MSTPSLASLLKEAEAAPSSTETPTTSRWTIFLPVVETLSAKGYTVRSAVKWLVSRNAFAKEDAERAYSAIQNARQRRRKEGLKP